MEASPCLYTPQMDKANSWNPDYSVGVNELDLQHQSLFRLVQELQNAIANGHGPTAVGTALNKAVNYTIHHFATEEDLMQQHRFPGAAAHRIEHNVLTLQLAELQQEWQSGDSNAPEKCLLILREWLDQHVLESDRQYMPFLSPKGAAENA